MIVSEPRAMRRLGTATTCGGGVAQFILVNDGYFAVAQTTTGACVTSVTGGVYPAREYKIVAAARRHQPPAAARSAIAAIRMESLWPISSPSSGSRRSPGGQVM